MVECFRQKQEMWRANLPLDPFLEVPWPGQLIDSDPKADGIEVSQASFP